MYLIAGLGNPTLKYHHTRHNAGFEAMDALSDAYGIRIRKRELAALTGSGYLDGAKVLLAKPQTFMNNSGDSIAAIVKYYGIDPEKEFVVISDDVTLDAGRLRIRRKGSAGGHNGLKSIIKCLGTENFPRLRIGVGAVPKDGDMINHVLGHPNRADRKALNEAYKSVPEAIRLMTCGRIDEAMNRFNG